MGTVHTPRGHLNFTEQGAGAPMVLVHSSGMTSRQWRGMAGTLSAGARVFCPDLLGCGQSAPAGPGFNLEHDVEAVRSLVAILGDDVALGGHSYGGLVALHVALQEPMRVRRLAVYEPVVFGLLDGNAPVAPGFFQRLREATVLPEGGVEAWLPRFVDFWQGDGAWAALGEQGRALMRASGDAAYRQVQAITARSLVPEEARGIRADTLVLCGSRSPAEERLACETLVANVPRARLAIIDGAGHVGPVTHGTVVAEHLARHLAAGGQGA